MLDKNKTNKTTGARVHQHLIKKGVETPMKTPLIYAEGSYKGIPVEHGGEPQRREIERLYSLIMEAQGLDLTDDSLIETPKRVSKVLTREKFYGLDYNNFPKCTTVINKSFDDSDLVIVRAIELNSLCEHHYEPILGKVYIGYIPGKNILGLSKFNRIVDFFARRPQIQERLTKQIFFALQLILCTDDIAIVIEADHMCVKTRGVMDSCSDTVTPKMGGKFKESAILRSEFYSLITKKRD